VALILLILLLVILLGVAGIAVHLLWWLAVILAVIWLLGFATRSGGGRRRWYRW
jgi:uncharacterized protein DUF5670